LCAYAWWPVSQTIRSRGDSSSRWRAIVSSTTPFQAGDLEALRRCAPDVVRRYAPEYAAEYSRRGWTMSPSIERVYVNARARRELGWRPRFDFRHVLECLSAGADHRSALSRAIGAKGYHARRFEDGPYPLA
jgi:nucleoside-diphosphate-sugar epimerase